MTPTPPTYDRRTVLRAAGATAVGVSIAGCLGVGGDGGPEGTVLEPPENYERRKEIDLPFPDYGEELPEVTVPAPLHDRAVTTTEFVGDRHTMLTFVYTTCTTVCPGLVTALRRVQADSISEGYAEEFAFLPTTFDPETDTAQTIEEYCNRMGIDREVGNWYFLRPETPERAKEVVEDTFGVAFDGGGGHYEHASLILLVNKDGLVERAYNGGPPDAGTATDDARTLLERW
ncbi:SCO family protein [Natronomonas sp. F2-12]|jgi:protein SCO1/2|uniref:SCO family protein n=1 Tax=Natronomonas aquatica TaxID=2841590 RepID=A0A9R1CQ35_9EURY|nr:SCO family protein [Natronomonas aquatica]MCQ4332963.1 SCO family protein [Natronomonas aquatica]